MTDPIEPNPNPNPPPAEPDWKKKAEEYESKLKDQDSKINELQTTIQTFNKRFEAPPPGAGADNDEKELQEIETMRSYDPDGAAKRMSQFLRSRDERIATQAVQKATGQIATQNVIEKLKSGVKSSNPEFDDDIVDVIMQRAESIAAQWSASGIQGKKAEEAVQEAVKFVKGKFEAYASKTKAVPPLPPGAGAEGGNNPPPAPPPIDKVEEPSEYIEKQISAKNKRIL